MRVLILGGWAGIGQTLTEALNQVGAQATYFEAHNANIIIRVARLLSQIPTAQIIHLNYISILRYDLDKYIMRLTRTPFIYHFHGTELRGTQSSKRHFKNFVYVSSPDLLQLAESDIGVEWLPAPVPDLYKCSRTFPQLPTQGKIIIFHPNPRANPYLLKGTHIIRDAITHLSNEFKLKYIEGGGIPHELMAFYYKNADIVVDQISSGIYGVSTVEAWYFSKPVITSWSYGALQPIPALYATDYNTLCTQLRRLIQDSALRAYLGKKGRKFALKHHAPLAIAKRCYKKYEEVIRCA